MKNFNYIRPSRMDEAIAALRTNENPHLLAGGTDLLVGMKTNTVRPKCIIDLKGIPQINSIEYDDGFKIGALTTVRDIETSPLIRKKIPALGEAAATLGSIQIRNRATVGGNLCHGSPAADMSVILLAMHCETKIISPDGEKQLALDRFFCGPGITVLAKDEVLSEIIIPKKIENHKGIYLKHGPRKAMDIGIVNIAILMDADFRTRRCNQITIALGAVASTPIRAKKAETLVNGKTLTTELIHEAAETASSEAKPISDFRASAAYRRELVKSLVVKGIQQILAQNSN
jgi:aerobic carbon-monoxide dehydrogenase medium subunit